MTMDFAWNLPGVLEMVGMSWKYPGSFLGVILDMAWDPGSILEVILEMAWDPGNGLKTSCFLQSLEKNCTLKHPS
jgi:hypothetical protein